jgi:hypothetical protein
MSFQNPVSTFRFTDRVGDRDDLSEVVRVLDLAPETCAASDRRLTAGTQDFAASGLEALVT